MASVAMRGLSHSGRGSGEVAAAWWARTTLLASPSLAQACAARLHSTRVGAINIIKEGGFLPVMIIANWSKKQ